MATKVKVGINGLGRIGRCVLKIILDREDVQVVGVNDLVGAADMAYLIEYDSVHHRYRKGVEGTDGKLKMNGSDIPYISERDPAKVPWKDVGADVVIESSGVFTRRDTAAAHLKGGAKKVIISAPANDADGTFCPGVNLDKWDNSKHEVVSMASCTTNSIAPVARILHREFGIEHLLMSTIHAYTSSQAIQDAPQKKRRRGRAAAVSIVPTSTGAAKATGLVIPELKGKMDGMAFRVPVVDGSVTDIVANLGKKVSADDVNEALRKASKEKDLEGILRVSDDEIVSVDIIGDSHSATVDGPSTMTMGEKMVKVLSWYDNEWGYSSRLADFAGFIGNRLVA